MSDIRAVGGRMVEFFAACFCVVWFLTLFAFPHLKGAPSGYLPVLLGIGFAIAADRRGWLNRFADRSAVSAPALQRQHPHLNVSSPASAPVPGLQRQPTGARRFAV